MPARTKAVIFDLYGTLLRLPVAPLVLVDLLRNVDACSLRAAIDELMRVDLPTLSDMCRHFGVSRPADFAELERALAMEVEQVEPFVEAIEVLERVAGMGLRVGVISNLATPFKLPFTACGLDRLVDVTVFSTDCGLLKPDPCIYELALERLAVRSSEVVMVGDSLRCDVEGPRSVGIRGLHLVRSRSSGGTTLSSLHGLFDHLD